MSTLKKEREHFDATIAAIVNDYLFDSAAIMEINTAKDNFWTEVEDYIAEELEESGSFGKAFEKKFREEDGDLKEEEFAKFVKNHIEEMDDPSMVLGVIGNEEIANYLNDHGYQVIQTNNIADQAKLDEFLRTELYPNHSDQLANLFS